MSINDLALRCRHRAEGPPGVQYQCAMMHRDVLLACNAPHHLDAASTAFVPGFMKKNESREGWGMMENYRSMSIRKDVRDHRIDFNAPG
jgi:hypothetical protein